MGFPGEEETDIELAATIGGTLDNWRLEEDDDRCRIVDDDIDSVNALLESRMD